MEDLNSAHDGFNIQSRNLLCYKSSEITELITYKNY
jgi:hypothetical protein